MTADLRAFVGGRLDQAARLWSKDLAALDEAYLNRRDGSARSIADIAYETILVNRRIATRLRGEVPDPMEGFPACPAELAIREALAAAISESANAVLDSLGEPDRSVEFPDGSTEPAFDYAEFAAIHMMYHLGQINYVQTLYGDTKVHWRD